MGQCKSICVIPWEGPKQGFLSYGIASRLYSYSLETNRIELLFQCPVGGIYSHSLSIEGRQWLLNSSCVTLLLSEDFSHQRFFAYHKHSLPTCSDLCTSSCIHEASQILFQLDYWNGSIQRFNLAECSREGQYDPSSLGYMGKWHRSCRFPRSIIASSSEPCVWLGFYKKIQSYTLDGSEVLRTISWDGLFFPKYIGWSDQSQREMWIINKNNEESWKIYLYSLENESLGEFPLLKCSECRSIDYLGSKLLCIPSDSKGRVNCYSLPDFRFSFYLTDKDQDLAKQTKKFLMRKDLQPIFSSSSSSIGFWTGLLANAYPDVFFPSSLRHLILSFIY